VVQAMNLGYRLSQQQNIKLTMTPELKQSIHILQLSSADLTLYLQEQSVENPVLEMSFKPSGSKQDRIDPIDLASNGDETLEEMIISQLRMTDIPQDQFKIASYLAGNLNEDGYLTMPLDEVCFALNQSLESIEKALGVVQSLDPSGVGARSLKECLLIQIKRDPYAESWSYEIAGQYLPQIGSGKLSMVAEQLQIPLEQVKHVLEYIRTLNPRPGLPYCRVDKKYIFPDAVILQQQGSYSIVMNEANFPPISINSNYEKWSAGKQHSEAKFFLQQKVQSALWLIRSLKQRKVTLYKVIKAIIEEQVEFLDHGIQAMKPMNLKLIADKLDMHESTVSRAVHEKYIQTPRGIYELKYFFTNGLQTNDGRNASSKSVKARLKELIESEEKKKPLSDQKIANLFGKEGIQISRRTVTKYREELQLLPSIQRKEY
jgi:RNA polymerase sigma-54 factor